MTVDAFEALYHTYRPLVFGVARRLVHDSQSADDVVQAVFLTVWRRLDTFDGTNLDGWLRVLARNAAIDVRRRESRSAALYESVARYRLLDTDEFEDGLCGRLSCLELLARCVLKSSQRDLLVLAFFSDLTYAEIATLKRLPLGTVKTRIRGGLEALRKSRLNDCA